MNRKTVVALVAALAALQVARADVPYQINYQGWLYDDGGAPVDTNALVTAGLYASATGGVAAYTETVGMVSVEGGLYSFQFGTNSPAFLAALALPQVWLEITMDAQPLDPRQRLLAVPYALFARQSEGLVSGNRLTFGNGSYLVHDGTNLFLVSAGGAFLNQLTFNAPEVRTNPIVNLVLPANGGVLESFTSERPAALQFAIGLADNIKTGRTNSWSSAQSPATPQEFIYSFSNGLQATISQVVIHNYGQADSGFTRYSRNFSISTSPDGIAYVPATNGVLLNNTNAQSYLLPNITAKRIKLTITSGYNTRFWQLGEFIVLGQVIDDNAPPSPGIPVAPAATNNKPVVVTFSGASDTGGSGLKEVTLLAKKGGGAWVDTGLSVAAAAGSFAYTGVTTSDTYHFSLRATDHAGNASATPGAVIASTVYTMPPNQPPLASSDEATATTNVPVIIRVLDNDTDPDGDALTIATNTAPTGQVGQVNGTVSIVSNATCISYTPASTGSVSFSYVASDQRGGLATGTVSVTVSGESLYMVIDVSGGANASSYPVSYLAAPPADLLSNDIYKTTRIVLRRCPAGVFIQGSPTSEAGRKDDDTDEIQHQVTLTRPFYACVFEITQAQFANVTGSNPSQYRSPKRPVDTINWSVRGGVPASAPLANTFHGRLRARTGLAFDFPTDAQWEYACRAGTTTALNSGKNLLNPEGEDRNVDEVGWYGSNSGGTTHDVGLKRPNNWGLYDMHGNIQEWTRDYFWWFESSRALVDPLQTTVDPNRGTQHPLRGSNFIETPENMRSADRWTSYEDTVNSAYGFRSVVDVN